MIPSPRLARHAARLDSGLPPRAGPAGAWQPPETLTIQSNHQYKGKYSRHWMTIPQTIRHNRRVSVLFLVIAVAGLWLRYGHG